MVNLAWLNMNYQSICMGYHELSIVNIYTVNVLSISTMTNSLIDISF